jgi:hypothetical protein
MLFYGLPLLGIQRPCLEQHRIGDADLPHIIECRSERQLQACATNLARFGIIHPVKETTHARHSRAENAANSVVIQRTCRRLSDLVIPYSRALSPL